MRCAATAADLQHRTVTKGRFYYLIAIIPAQLAQPGPSWSPSLASLGTRLWFQAGRQPRPTYQPVTFPSPLAFPPGCQKTRPKNSRGCLTTLHQTKPALELSERRPGAS